eukprot:m.173507 g.173507  ORF g.173507 m.173507 type:complete len:171 (-) comp9951_c0_seq22:459-971(-)
MLLVDRLDPSETRHPQSWRKDSANHSATATFPWCSAPIAACLTGSQRSNMGASLGNMPLQDVQVIESPDANIHGSSEGRSPSARTLEGMMLAAPIAAAEVTAPDESGFSARQDRPTTDPDQLSLGVHSSGDPTDFFDGEYVIISTPSAHGQSSPRALMAGDTDSLLDIAP